MPERWSCAAAPVQALYTVSSSSLHPDMSSVLEPAVAELTAFLRKVSTETGRLDPDRVAERGFSDRKRKCCMLFLSVVAFRGSAIGMYLREIQVCRQGGLPTPMQEETKALCITHCTHCAWGFRINPLACKVVLNLYAPLSWDLRANHT